MKKSSIFALALALVFAVACKTDKKETDVNAETPVENSETKKITNPSDNDGKEVWVALNSKSGSSVTGNVIFEQKGNLVTMLATLSGLDAGTHAIH